MPHHSRRRFIASLSAAPFTASSLLGDRVPAANPREQAENHQTLADYISYGADYYPEDWPSERLTIDARLMSEAGFRTIRIADTNWERLEPDEGRFDFGWVDRTLETFNRVGIKVILCTSSYAPPAWLISKHPDFLIASEQGERRRWGGMGPLCLHNPSYREYVARLVTALATRYGRHPGVLGWQVDNELGGTHTECYDQEYCQPRFREYLREKFKTLDELNRRLWTISYGHRYSSWDQILLRTDVEQDALQAPLVLEAKRFFSQTITDFVAFQVKLLRRHISDQFITHNVYFTSMNCFDLAQELDFLGEDCYPLVGQVTSPAFTTDLMRGFNRGRSFHIMEMRSGEMGPYTLGDCTPPPGLARLWAWQTIAHGADGVLFFRWRMSNGGSEQYWQGLLNYDGSPSLVFPEVQKLGKELRAVGRDIVHAETPSEIAVLFSYDSLWALEIGGRYPYLEQARQIASAFRRYSMNVDLIDPTTVLAKYKVVVAPSLLIVSSHLADALRNFVADGGILILTARSGSKNEDNLATSVAPGLLETLAQVRVTEATRLRKTADPHWLDFKIDQSAYQPSPTNAVTAVAPDWPGTYQCREWVEILECHGATTLFQYQHDFYAGRPAVTSSFVGKGRVIYAGTLLEPEFYLDLVAHVCKPQAIDYSAKLPSGVDFALRQKGDAEFRFLLNFTTMPQTVELVGRHRELLSQRQYVDRVTISPMDLGIFVNG